MIVTTLPPFASGADLAAFTRGKIAADDAAAQLTLDAVSSAFRHYCGWHIFPALDVTDVLDSSRGQDLQLPSRWVNSIAEVRNLTVDPATTWDAASYRWSRLGQIRLAGTTDYWPEGYQGTEVVYNSGYDQAPPELRMLCLQVASRSLSSPSGVTREQAGQVAVSYATVAPGVSGGLALLASEYALLDVFRIVGA